jgi:uncharacterized protein (TIGR02270 family)
LDEDRLSEPRVPPATNSVIPVVLSQHAEDLAMLWNSRQILSRSGHIELRRLARIDNRIAAHLDGCVVAGAGGFVYLLAGLADPTPAAIFSMAAAALESNDQASLEHVLTAAEALPDTFAGLASAFGWVPRERLAGVVRNLLVSASPFRRRLGFASCRLHGVDPGAILVTALHDPDPGVRAEAFRTAGTIGLVNLLTSCIAAMDDDDPACGFWAAWSAVLFGDRQLALEALSKTGLAPGPHRARAFRLALQAQTQAHALLQEIASNPEEIRRVILGSGIVGDPKYVPWLIGHMSNDALTRAAGEAFSLITGVDLALLDLERKPPENVESGPNDDPNDADVEMDADEGLPWPDPERIGRWWAAHSGGFQAGTRYFVGAPVTRAHCIEVLKNGYQRQRILAAHYLCLVERGTPLFNTSAPAWRQQRLLANMMG